MESEKKKLSLAYALRHHKWAKLLELCLIFVLAISLIFIFFPFVKEDLIKSQLLIWLVNIIMIIWVWLGIKLRGDSLKDFGLSLKYDGIKGLLNTFLWSLVVFALAVTGFVLGSIIMANITGIPEQADFSGYAYFQDNLGLFLISLLGIYFVSSFGEEFFYRAFLINRLQELGISKKWGTSIAVVISAVIFGFAHYQWGPMGIVQTTLMGLALGICFIWLKKRLLVLVLAHAYMDTLLMFQLYMAGS